DRVVVEPRHHVRAAADERLQRPRAAGKILQLHLDAFVAIEPELLRERRRQVDHLVLSADGEPDARSSRVPTAARGDKGTKGNKGQKGRYRGRVSPPQHDAAGPSLCGLCSPLCPCQRQPFQWSNHFSSRVTPALTMTTTTPSTVIPAKTPVVSKVPSACEM